MSDTYTVNSAGNYTITKDENATLDYTFDWSLWLNPLTDTISGTPVFNIIGNDIILTKSSQSNTTTSATIWLAGGTIGQTYQIQCKITTAQGRTDERSIYIKIADR